MGGAGDSTKLVSIVTVCVDYEPGTRARVVEERVGAPSEKPLGDGGLEEGGVAGAGAQLSHVQGARRWRPLLPAA